MLCSQLRNDPRSTCLSRQTIWLVHHWQITNHDLIHFFNSNVVRASLYPTFDLRMLWRHCFLTRTFWRHCSTILLNFVYLLPVYVGECRAQRFTVCLSRRMTHENPGKNACFYHSPVSTLVDSLRCGKLRYRVLLFTDILVTCNEISVGCWTSVSQSRGRSS